MLSSVLLLTNFIVFVHAKVQPVHVDNTRVDGISTAPGSYDSLPEMQNNAKVNDTTTTLTQRSVKSFAQLTKRALEDDEAGCFFIYELTSYEGGTMGGVAFNGRFVGTETQAFDTPFFETFDQAFIAALDESSGVPIGRTIGSFGLFPRTGIWSFQFFDDNSWITTSYGFIIGPNVVTGGTGDYLDITGSVASVRVWEETPELPYKIDRFEICAGAASLPEYEEPDDGCLTLYELTSYEGGIMGGISFNGRFVGTETQAFDTPFFSTYDEAFAAAIDESSGNPIGRTIGSFNLFPRTGIWSFQFFDDNSWITTSYGFVVGPPVVTGGTGQYLGATGTVQSVRVLEETPMLPYKIDRFDICM